MDAPNSWWNGFLKCLSTLNVLSFSWPTSGGDLAWCRNTAALTFWFPAKWMPHCGIAWHRNMATLTVWFPAKWRSQISSEMDVPNACPTLNVLSFPKLPVEVTLCDIEAWQLSQSGSKPNGDPIAELHDIETWPNSLWNGCPKCLSNIECLKIFLNYQ